MTTTLAVATTADNWRAHHTTERTAQEYRDELFTQALRFCRLLDFPCEPCDLTDRWFAHWLRRLALVADGKTIDYAADVVSNGNKTKGAAPKSSLASTITGYEWRYDDAKTNRQRLKLILEIQTEVLRIKFAPKVVERYSPEWREQVATSDGSNAEICARYGVSNAALKNYRKQFRVSKASGKAGHALALAA